MPARTARSRTHRACTVLLGVVLAQVADLVGSTRQRCKTRSPTIGGASRRAAADPARRQAGTPSRRACMTGARATAARGPPGRPLIPALEAHLAHGELLGYGDGVVVERRRTLAGAVTWRALEGEVVQRRGADVVAHSFDALLRGDELVAGGHVDAVEAGDAGETVELGVGERLAGAGLVERVDQLAGGCCRARSSRRPRRGACPR